MDKVKKKVTANYITFVSWKEGEDVCTQKKIIYGKKTRNKIEKIIRKECDNHNVCYCAILDIETLVLLYEMPLDEFINNAKVCN